MRANSDLIKAGKMNVFTCTVDKSLSRRDAFNEYIQATKELKEWIDFKGTDMSYKNAAIEIIANTLYDNGIYGKVSYNGKTYPIKNDVRIRHPYPHIGEGGRFVNCLTDLSNMDSLELAALLYKVDMRSVNTLLNQIRRRASILERPLVNC